MAGYGSPFNTGGDATAGIILYTVSNAFQVWHRDSVNWNAHSLGAYTNGTPYIVEANTKRSVSRAAFQNGVL